MLKDLGLLVIRMSTGATMMAHGYPKLFGGKPRELPETIAKTMGEEYPPTVEQGGPQNFAKTLESLEVPNPEVAAYGSGLAEFGGGLALLLGFKTRLAALLIMGNLGVAIRKVHWEKGFFGNGGYEFPAALWSSALALFLAGPGAISLDAIVHLLSGGNHDDDEDDE
jgi:putative oxidoreductase